MNAHFDVAGDISVVTINSIFSSGLFRDGEVNQETRSILDQILKSINASPDASYLVAQVLAARSDISQETKNYILSFQYHLAIPPISNFSNDVLINIQSHEFNIWEIPDPIVFVDLIVYIFRDLGLLERFSLLESNFRLFVLDLYEHYAKDTPYHNFKHCFDVFHCVYIFFLTTELKTILTPLELYAILISALVHDVGHNGFNNSFHIATESSLALVYNDQSVLENYHCSLGYYLIRKHNLPVTLTAEEHKYFKKLLIDGVLSTDLARHHSLLKRLESILLFDPSDESHRQILVTCVLKCADISNPIKPFKIAKKWGKSVQKEFLCQGLKEKELGLSDICEPVKDKESFANMQIAFSESLVKPLYKLMGRIVPHFLNYVEILDKNRENWILYKNT